MNAGSRAVLVVAEIKAVIEDFDRGETNAVETLAKILDACGAVEPPVTKRDAA